MSASRPHVAYVCADRGVPVLGTKGGSTHIRELVNALSGRGADVAVLAARATDGDAQASIRGRLIEVLPERFSRSLRNAIRRTSSGALGEATAAETLGLMMNQEMTTQLRRLHARWGIDVMYERYSLWSYAGLTFARAHGIPFLLEVNAPLRLEQARYRTLRSPEVAEALEGQILRLADRVLVPSSVLRDYVIAQGARPGRVRVLPNAADAARFRPVAGAEDGHEDPRAFTVGFVGSLKPWHGVDDLLLAFARLHRRDRSYRLLIVGDGPLRPAIDTICQRNGFGEAVIVAGDVSFAEIPGWLRRMDVAVAPYPALPSFYFSPLKIYEYMAAGRPIVASGIGQIAEVLTHRRTALLHPAGSVRKMVDHVEELRARPRLRARLGRDARRLLVKRFTWDRNAARILAMIETLHRAIAEGRYAPAEEPVL